MLSGTTIELNRQSVAEERTIRTEKSSSYGSFNEITMDQSSSNNRNKTNSNSHFDRVSEGHVCDVNAHHRHSDPLAPPTITNLYRTSSARPTTNNNNDDRSWVPIQDHHAQSFFSTTTNATAATTDTASLPEPTSESMIIAGSVANLCSATLGAGVLALPYALYQAGIIIGGILLVLSALVTMYSIDLIVMACHTYNKYTYEAVTEHVLGSRMKYYIELAILLFSGGCAVAYVIAVGDILDKSHLLFRHSRAATITLVWFVAMMPLSMLRRMQNLQFASAFGIASIGTLVFAAAVHLFQDVDYDDDAQHDEQYIIRSCLWPSRGIVSVLTACPIILFAFSCQCNVAAIFEELPDKIVATNPNQINNLHRVESTMTTGTAVDDSVDTSPNNCTKDILMHKVTMYSVGICALLYGMVSFIALSDFGEEMTPNMLSSYRPVGVMQVAMSAMAVAVVMAFPLNIFPARVTLNGWIPASWFAREQCEGNELGTKSTLLPLISTTAFDASRAPSEQMELLADCVDHEHEIIRSASSVASLLGSSAVSVTETTLTSPLLDHDRSDNHSGVLQASTAAKPIVLVPVEKMDDDDLNFSWKRHVVLTLFLTGITLALALILPNISVVFGLLGGTASSFLGFCVPGLLGIQLSADLFDQSHDSIRTETSIGTNLNNDVGSDNVPEQEQLIQPNTSHTNQRRAIHNTTTIGMFCSKRKLLFVSWSLLVSGIVVGIVTTAVTFYSTVLS